MSKYHTSTGVSVAGMLAIGVCPTCLGKGYVLVKWPLPQHMPLSYYRMTCHRCGGN